MTSFIDYATVSMADSDKLSAIREQLSKPRRFRIRYWNKTNQDWDFRTGYFDKNSQIRVNKAGNAIVITYLEIWTDDGGITHENYRSAVADNEHQVLFQTRKKVQ